MAACIFDFMLTDDLQLADYLTSPTYTSPFYPSHPTNRVNNRVSVVKQLREQKKDP